MYDRIVSLAPSNTEILYALGLKDKVVGVTRFCDYPPEAKEKKMVGGWLDINDELVDSLNPDLILTSTFVQDEITERYEKKGLNIAAVRPKTLEEVYDSIASIAKLTEKEREAEELINKMKEEFKKAEKLISDVGERPKLYIEEWHKPPTVSGNWVPEIAEIAKTDYSLIEPGVYSEEVTAEELVDFDPEFIILSWCGFKDKSRKDWVRKREDYGKIKAVKENNIFVFDDSLLNRPGPRLTKGLRKIIKTVHGK